MVISDNPLLVEWGFHSCVLVSRGSGEEFFFCTSKIYTSGKRFDENVEVDGRVSCDINYVILYINLDVHVVRSLFFRSRFIDTLVAPSRTMTTMNVIKLFSYIEENQNSIN